MQTSGNLLVQRTKNEELQKLQSESFLCLNSYSLSFIQGVFKSHLRKNTATQSANSHPKSQFDLSPFQLNVLKNGPGTQPLIPQGRGEGVQTMHHGSLKFILLTLLFFFSIEVLKSKIVGKIFTNYTFSCLKSTLDTPETGIKYAPD